MESKQELKDQFVHTKYATRLVVPVLKDRLRMYETHWHADIPDEKRREYAVEKNLILLLAGLFGVSKDVRLSSVEVQVNSDASCTDDGNP